MAKADRALAAKVGKDFEAAVQAALVSMQAVIANKTRALRLFDTHSAGNFLPEQPGDFMVACPAGAVIVEAKSSTIHNSLKGCLSANMDFGQASQLQLWTMSGHPALVVFLDHQAQRVEFWEGGYVGTCRIEGQRLRTDQMLTCCWALDMPRELTRLLLKQDPLTWPK